MRAETRKSSTNIHSFSMNKTCFLSQHHEDAASATVTLVFTLKKYVYHFSQAALLFASTR